MVDYTLVIEWTIIGASYLWQKRCNRPDACVYPDKSLDVFLENFTQTEQEMLHSAVSFYFASWEGGPIDLPKFETSGITF